MNNFPSKDLVLKSIKTGLENAKNNFTHWTSDELALSFAPPKFLTIHISQELAKLEFPPEIYIDASVSDILRCSLPNRDDYKTFMKNKGLSQDIVHLTLDERFSHQNDNDSVSRVIMTVQNGIRNVQDEYTKEIDKMCKMIDRTKKEDSTLDYAVFTFYMDISNRARKKSARRLNEIIDSFDEVVQKYKTLESNFEGGDVTIVENTGEWCFGYYIIEPKF